MCEVPFYLYTMICVVAKAGTYGELEADNATYSCYREQSKTGDLRA